MNADAMSNRLLVECLARMAKALIDQSRDTPAKVVGAAAGVPSDQRIATELQYSPTGRNCQLARRADEEGLR